MNKVFLYSNLIEQKLKETLHLVEARYNNIFVYMLLHVHDLVIENNLAWEKVSPINMPGSL